jgi:hypothetical protein
MLLPHHGKQCPRKRIEHALIDRLFHRQDIKSISENLPDLLRTESVWWFNPELDDDLKEANGSVSVSGS